MKILSATLALAIAVTGMTARMSYAGTDRFALWDQLDAATATLFNDQKIDEYEDQTFEEVLGLGRTGKTDEAIKALNVFLKDSRNSALREVAKKTFAELIKQQKAIADNRAKHVNNESACTLDMRVCPNGEIVGREEPRCTFVQCPER